MVANRIKVIENSVTTDYTLIANGLNQYAAVGGINYSYDLNGNLTYDGVYRYYYDCENRLVDVNEANDAPVVSYKYDYMGRRISKTIHDSLTTIHYTYDGHQVIAEYEDGAIKCRFYYGQGIDEPICMYKYGDNAGFYYYHHYDGLGSVAALSDDSGQITERYEYDVFGEATSILSSFLCEILVSIHAPVKGATWKHFDVPRRDFVSIHAPVKGAT